MSFVERVNQCESLASWLNWLTEPPAVCWSVIMGDLSASCKGENWALPKALRTGPGSCAVHSMLRYVISVTATDIKVKIDGLVQNCSNSSTLAMELLKSCTEPSICFDTWKKNRLIEDWWHIYALVNELLLGPEMAQELLLSCTKPSILYSCNWTLVSIQVEQFNKVSVCLVGRCCCIQYALGPLSESASLAINLKFYIGRCSV